MDNTQLIAKLNREFQTDMSQSMSEDELLQKLSKVVNHLINTDFEKLIFILYKTDVSEIKLKQLLRQNSHEDSSLIIAKLIIEREKQKDLFRSGGSY